MQTIKIWFEKIIEKDTKEINVPNLSKHMADKFFLVDPELAIMPIDPSREEKRIIKKNCTYPPK